ncbi:unnamed protein product [Moneuplotes crassus]|uniref:RING-type domain-containing protein n=1 Tax=Euplotes crassus TaxID=5936 RepID=A0AAD1U9W2_EUPCR|nr:unnamed protein product [Moneuplotes crassus]
MEEGEKFHCRCGVTITHFEFQDHYTKCDELYADYCSITKEFLNYRKNSKKAAQLQNLKALCGFFTLLIEEKEAAFQKRKDKKTNIDRGLLCVLCKRKMMRDKKVLPCFHQACEACLKEAILQNPLQYPCPKCKKDPVSDTHELDQCLVNNLLDNPQGQFFPEDVLFLKKYTDVRKAAVVEKAKDIQVYGEKCRYCSGATGIVNKEKKSFDFHLSCISEDCLRLNKLACTHELKCKHLCAGLKSSQSHFCLDPKCVEKDPEKTLGITGEDSCIFCTEKYNTRPCVILDCKHVYDYDCLLRILTSKWQGPQVDFTYLKCWCGAQISTDNKEIMKIVKADLKIKKRAEKVAVDQAREDHLATDDLEKSPYNGDFKSFAVAKISVYQCSKCDKVYYAGLRDCGDPSFRKEECLCKECTDAGIIKIQSRNICSKHPEDYILFKCKFCCKEAIYFCWDTTHFCDECHRKQSEDPYYEATPPDKLHQCNGKDDCPLGIAHPLNGQESFPIKCMLCLGT